MDLIDTASLGSRGVVFETGGLGDAALDSGVGLGDFNGDGVSDLFFFGREAGVVDAVPYPALFSIVFGRPGLAGRHLLGGPLPGGLNFRLKDVAATGLGSPRVRAAGDLDGDGFADAIFGMSSYRTEGAVRGRVCLLRGAPHLSGDHLVEEIGEGIRGTIFYSSDPQYGLLGADANNVGDFNGDGQPDLAIVGYSPSDSPNSRTALFLTFETKDLPSRVDVNDFGVRTPGLILLCRDEEIAQTVKGAGDFNGDGFGDLLLMTLGSRGPNTPTPVYLIYGRGNPEPLIDLQALAPEALGDHGIVTFVGPANTTHLDYGGGDQAAGIGDVNGDGFDDILIGAAYSGVVIPGRNPELSTARIFYGRPDFPTIVYFDAVQDQGRSTVIHSFNEGGDVGDGFALKLAGAGDVNADGVPDFLIGAPHATVGGRDWAGESYLLFGDREFPADVFLSGGFRGQRIIGEQTHGILGWILGSAGDFNGDGAPDILVGARTLYPDPPSPGRAYVIYGTGNGEPPFTVLGMEPASGPARGGTTVTIQGSGFRNGLEVRFGGETARSTQIISSVELRAVTPTAPQVGTVEVTLTLGGESRIVGEPFEYTPNLPDIDLSNPGIRGLRVDGISGAETGHALAFGDIDGDGVDDLIIGSIFLDGEMVVSVIQGGSGLPESIPAFDLSPRVRHVETGEVPKSDFRMRLKVVGDVNGDGIPDFGVADADSVGFLVFGRKDFPDDLFLPDAVATGTAVKLLPANADNTFYDFTFAAVGDLTGDGIDDFAIGLANAAGDVLGRVLFVAGRRTWPQVFHLIEEEAFATLLGRSHAFGYEIVVPGDVNGDGSLNLLACCEEPPEPSRAYLIPLVPALAGELAVESFVESQGGKVIDRVNREWAFSHFMHVSAVGDVNGDGHPDVLVSDEGGAENLQGITFLVPGGPSLPAQISLPTASPDPADGLVRIFGSSERVQSGRALGPAGDFNGDGFADFLVGEQNLEPFSPGNMFVMLGDKKLPGEIHLHRPGRHALRLAGTQDVTRLDVSTPRAGDLNGDGRADFAFSEMGSPRYPSKDGVPSPGVVHVVYGVPSSVPFIRGDANFDGAVNISDAIFTLSYLFLGGAAPLCDDAADADDSGQIEITDAIRTLNTLFLGNASLPEPYPEAGDDPSPDVLGCRGF